MADSVSQIRSQNFLQDAIAEGKIVPVAFEKCPLCCENRSFLLCDSCVNKGSFTHTQRRDCGKFRHLRERWKAQQGEREERNRKFELEIDDIERANRKRTEIESMKIKIMNLKKAIAESRSRGKSDKAQLRDSKLRRRQHRAFLEQQCYPAMTRLNDRISDLEQTSSLSGDAKLNEGTSIDPKSIKDLKSSRDHVSQELHLIRANFITCLTRHIFSVQEVSAISEVDNLAMSMATALKDACETAFIGGRWVHTDHRGENHYQIVSTTLPDYSGESCAMHLYVMANNHATDKPAEVSVGDPTYGIQASLGYTAMLTNLMSLALNIPLPRKCSFRELCEELSEPDFSNFVWRLHENVQYLASCQGVRTQDLVNHLSLRNVLTILQSSSLGRDEPFMTKYTLPVTADLCQSEYMCDIDTSVTDMDLSRDWERVPVGIPSVESVNLPLGVSAPVDNNTSTAGALISNAAASLAGWWRSYYN